MLFLFGIGFFAANAQGDRRTCPLSPCAARRLCSIWQNPKPRYYGFTLALGAMLGLLVVFKLFVLSRPPEQLFGEVMMFVYSAMLLPLEHAHLARVLPRRRLVRHGFMPWGQISAVSWREDEPVTLVLISHFRSIAQRLQVPGPALRPGAPRAPRQGQGARHPHRGPGLDLGSRTRRPDLRLESRAAVSA